MGTGLPGLVRPHSWQARIAAKQRTESARLPWISSVDTLLEAANLPANYLLEWRSLRQETNSTMLEGGILHLATRLEHSGGSSEIQAAARLYEVLASHGVATSDRARRGLEALLGRGGGGERFEVLARSFARQTADPVLLLSLGIASGVYATARLGFLARFSQIPNLGGFGARTMASTAAFALEVPAWVFSERGIRQFSGQPVEWNGAALNRDLVTASLSLGLLKLTGFGGRLANEGLRTSMQGWTRLAGPLLPQAAMLGGIYLSHRVEAALGLRPTADRVTTLVDSLAFLLQANLAGKLSSKLLGEGFSRYQRGLEIHANRLTPSLVFNVQRVAASNLASHPAMQSVFLSQARNPSGGVSMSEPRSRLIEGRLDQLARPELEEARSALPPKYGRPNRRIRRIGILTSGGDGPGENAAVLALVRGATEVYGWEVMGVFDGFRGLLEPTGKVRPLRISDVSGRRAAGEAIRLIYGNHGRPIDPTKHSDISTLAGNMLRSSRINPLLGDPTASRIRSTLKKLGIDALVVLGGNGSIRVAAELDAAGVPLVFIPQSIDADVPGSILSIGFPSAVAKGAAEVQHFYATGQSCDRWFFVEIMGQHYGALALTTAREGKVDSVFLETPRPMGEIPRLIRRRGAEGQRHGVIVVSESVEFKGENGGRILPPRGLDKNDRLLIESGDIAKWLSQEVTGLGVPHTRGAPLGYLLRGADPTSQEIALADTLVSGALQLVNAGKFGRTVGVEFRPRSEVLQVVSAELSDVAWRKKRLPRDWVDFVVHELEQK